MWPFKRKEPELRELTIEQILLGLEVTAMDKNKAMQIPAVAACIGLISDTIAMMPVKLYRENGTETEEVKGDVRVSLLNDNTGDTLDGFQFKKALVTDFLLTGAGYAYINRKRNKVESLHYVDPLRASVSVNQDPIFKSLDLQVNGTTYPEYDFIRMTRMSRDGVSGAGILQENLDALTIAYNTMLFENALVATGGNKKGFLKAEGKVTAESLEQIKTQWSNLYKNNTENVIVLNSGLSFQEASQTSVEMQLNENKRTNAQGIYTILRTPKTLIEGGASETDSVNWSKYCIMPIVSALQTALNKGLLLSKEQGSYYFAVDMKEVMKADDLTRWQAYEIASRNGLMQADEIRYQEDLPPLGLDYIKFGLQDVFYNPKEKTFYTPNTDKTSVAGATMPGGGEKDED